jgi:predicted CXXCH cytochrome family protein
MLRGKSILVICTVLLTLFCFLGKANAAPPCRDRDSDGYFNKGGCGTAIDCNDNDASINPGAVEECTDGIDNDCDGLIDIQDPDAVNCPNCTDWDGDGYYVEGGGCGPVDCDDVDPNINPGIVEVCGDYADNDCDSLIDASDPDCGGSTACSDYTGKGLCNEDPNCEWIGKPKKGYCQYALSCTDADGDTYSPDGVNCGPVDCNDSDPAINPGADDSNCNGVDEDCSSVADDGYVPTPTSCGMGECAASGQLECQSGVEVDTCLPGTPAADDSVCNGVDDDCDGAVDEEYVTSTTNCGVGVCSSTGLLECQSGVEVDTCLPGIPAADDSVCNGVDDDCDGAVDEDYVTSTTNCGVGVCSSTGLLECQSGVEVDTCLPGTPSADDSACNGLDDDCNGQVDDDYIVSPTTCGVGECAASGQLECHNGYEVDDCSPLPAGTEGPEGNPTCTDTLDNDCDGDTDGIDIDCGTASACIDCHESLPQYDHFDADGHGKDGVSITCAGCHEETHTGGSYKHLKVINGYPYPDAAPDPYGAVLPRQDYCTSACHLLYHGEDHPNGYDYLLRYDIWTYIEILTPQDYISKYGEDPKTLLPGSVLPLLDVDNDSSNSYGDIVMCTTCHDPHGTSVGNKMNRVYYNYLCEECHTQ